jgi:hypothetical protein
VADGVSVFTSYGDVWLGDPKFEPVMAELNRRKAVIYTHPDAPNCCRDPMVPEIRESIIEYGTDTTRAIARVLFSGTALRYRDVRWIFSHGGGTAPFLAERLIRTPSLNKKLAETVPNGAMRSCSGSTTTSPRSHIRCLWRRWRSSCLPRRSCGARTIPFASAMNT